MRTSRVAILSSVLLVLAASGCASEGEDSDGGADDPTSADAAEDPSPDTDAEPVRVAMTGPITGPFDATYGMLPTLLDSAAEARNADGGVQGRDLEFIYCDTEGDPAREASCAREAVEQGAIANLGIVQLTPDYIDAFGAEDVPIIGPFGRHPVEFTATNSWPVTAGNVGLLAGATRMLLEGGAENVQVVVSSSPGGALARAHMTAGFDPIGAAPAGVTLMPEDSTDASSIVAAASSSSDAVATMLTTAATAQYLASRAAVGDDSPTTAGTINLPTLLVRDLGPAVEGVLLTSPVVPLHVEDNPGVQRLRSAAEDAGLDADDWTYPEYVSLVWANYEILLAALDAADEMTPGGLQEALGSLQADVGIIAPVDFTEPLPLYPGLDRVFNNQMLFGRATDGRFEPFSTDWVDPSAEELAIDVPALDR